MITLKAVAAFVDGFPWCATKGPGRPPRGKNPPNHAERELITDPQPDPWRSSGTRGPQPEPWRVSELEATFWESLHLYQIGQSLTVSGFDKLGSEVMIRAESLYDEGGCGNEPMGLMYFLLYHRPPNPQPSYLNTIDTTATVMKMGKTTGGQLGQQLVDGGHATIRATLNAG